MCRSAVKPNISARSSGYILLDFRFFTLSSSEKGNSVGIGTSETSELVGALRAPLRYRAQGPPWGLRIVLTPR